MARQFEIPEWYRSPIVSSIKRDRAAKDPRKKDLQPTEITAGFLTFRIARHFGFCFGVEHAIETAFRAIDENPSKRIFLLSEMIHNPAVNKDLETRGVKFLMRTDGTQLIPLDDLTPDDVVIVPAFGTTISMIAELASKGISLTRYDATCPFVEKVWTRARQLGEQGYTIIIHGKHYHEETRATFSRAETSGPSIVIRNHEEATLLAQWIRGEGDQALFDQVFAGKTSPGFVPSRDLKRIGVVNQTTMLAHETIAIADFLKAEVLQRASIDPAYGFADTRDTLCYATEENQSAIRTMVDQGGDLAIVVGGYNSSNTAHLAKLCAQKLPTFHIQNENEIISRSSIRHFSIESGVQISEDWIPTQPRVTILISAGASSPDSLIDAVIRKILTICEVPSHELQGIPDALNSSTATAAV